MKKSRRFFLRVDDFDVSLMRARRRYNDLTPAQKDKAYDEIVETGRRILQTQTK
jgi:hypothetical protein